MKIKEEAIIYKEGKPSAVILSLKEYKRMLSVLEDISDLEVVKKRKNEPLIPFEKIVKKSR